MDNYEFKDREFYEDYRAMVGDSIVKNYKELEAAINDQVINGNDRFRESRERLKSRYNKYTKGGYSEFVFNKIKESIKN